MGEHRQSRTVPNAATSIRLQDRDRWILEALLKCKFLTTTHLTRLFFRASASAANKRLRRLLDRGMLNVWVRRLEEQNIYSLSARGARLCASSANPSSVPRGLDQVDHVLLINDARVEFALSVEALGGSLSWWRSDWELRIPGRTSIPDAMFGIRWGHESEKMFLLEADNATRSQRMFLQKLLRYVGSMDGFVHHRDFRGVLIVAEDPIWAERYRRIASGASVNFHVWFTSRCLLQNDFGGLIWKTWNDEQNHSLRSIVSHPYGKEGISFTTRSWGTFGKD